MTLEICRYSKPLNPIVLSNPLQTLTTLAWHIYHHFMSLIQPLQDVFIDRALENLIQYKTLNPKPQTPKKPDPSTSRCCRHRRSVNLPTLGRIFFTKGGALIYGGGLGLRV